MKLLKINLLLLVKINLFLLINVNVNVVKVNVGTKCISKFLKQLFLQFV